MVRTPCAPPPPTTSDTMKGSELLPASVDGCRKFIFEAKKIGAVAGKNAGTWKVFCQVRVKKRVTFDHKWSLVFALDDDIKDRDAECLEQLRNALAECWHRVTSAPKATCHLDLGRDFSGPRYVRIEGEKKKMKQTTFALAATASCSHGTYSRATSYIFKSDADGARQSASALLAEIANTWACATRTKDHFASSDHSSKDDDDDIPRGVGVRTLNYIRDVYGSGSNVDSIIQQHRV